MLERLPVGRDDLHVISTCTQAAFSPRMSNIVIPSGWTCRRQVSAWWSHSGALRKPASSCPLRDAASPGALQRERSVPGRDVTRSSARIAASRGGRSRVGPGQSSRYVPTMLRAPPSAPGASWAGLTVVESSRDHSSTGGPARYSCTAKIAIAPSPAAEATRFTERWRTSPIANTPGMLVSMA